MNANTRTVAIVDNYDSFTYNLFQYFSELGSRPDVYRNDSITVEQLSQYSLIVISPGPGTPSQAGISLAVVRQLSGLIPILGVCLGHQTIAEAFGGVVRRTKPMHGKTSSIRHQGTGVLAGLASPFTATRYHSLAVDPDTLPAELVPTAWASDGTIMALMHRSHPTFGVQFHPESVLTEGGHRIVANFLNSSPC
ncbi:anthranilate synthase component II [Streptomyces sp. NPDC058664]|uniref:anthranilate synthase component II n=1 Tax=unclassified Streptomyces TaxID=2593676 RepID=UPI0036693646